MSINDRSANKGKKAKQSPAHSVLDKEKAKELFRKWFFGPINKVIKWLNDHDNAIIAIATVAIASLTWSLAKDSGRQADTFSDQLKVMQSQLREMQSSSKQTNDLIAANKLLAESAHVANRAWISPLLTSIHGDVMPTHPIQVKIQFENHGRTPASNVEFHVIEIARESRAISEDTNVMVGENNSCGAAVTNYPGVIFPATLKAADFTYFFTNASETKKFMNRTFILVVQGCFRYQTLDEWHETKFCVYLKPELGKQIRKWSFSVCSDGNDAN